MEKKINICQALEGFYPYIDGGVKVMDNYAKQLSKDNRCCVLASNLRPKNFDYSVLPYKVIKCKAILPSGYNGMRVPSPSLDCTLKKRILSENFDIYHVHSPFIFSRFLQKIARKQKRPVVVTFHTKYKEDFARTVKSRLLQNALMKYMLKSFQRADAVWAPNAAAAEVLRGYGFSGEITVMPNGIDMQMPDNPLEAAQEIKQKYNILPEEKVLLFVGRLLMYKNLHFICDSLAVLKQMGQKFKMFFVGGGDDSKRLKHYIEKKGLCQNVILTGEITSKEELAKYYLASDVFLFPSKFDTAGISVIEAAFFQVPSVLLRGSTAAEGKTEDVNCLLSAENKEEYAQKILRLCTSEEERKILGENASRDLVLTWEQISCDVLQQYHQIIQKYNLEMQKNT